MRTALKDSFVAGLVLVAPLAVTLFVLRLLFNWVVGILNPVVESTRLTQYTANIDLVAQILAAVLIVTVVTALGYVAQSRSGQRMFGGAGRIVTFIPLVGTIYGSVRQVANALVDRGTGYERVVLVEWPREGIYAIGFVTSESPEPVETLAGSPVFNVYLPNSPNPTGGRLALVPEDRVHEVDMSVRRGIRMLVTTGMAEEEDDLPLPA